MIDSSDDTRGAGAVLKDFFARPLRLVLGDRQLSFATVADFEFALASRTEVPAAIQSDCGTSGGSRRSMTPPGSRTMIVAPLTSQAFTPRS